MMRYVYDARGGHPAVSAVPGEALPDLEGGDEAVETNQRGPSDGLDKAPVRILYELWIHGRGIDLRFRSVLLTSVIVPPEATAIGSLPWYRRTN